MLHCTNLLIYPFRRNSAGGSQDRVKGGEKAALGCYRSGTFTPPRGRPGMACGYALLFVMMATTVVLLSLTAALPSIYQEGQREREEELLFRGVQYARAIAGFHQKFQRYPTSIEELTELTNGWRFLRKEYADPMTPHGKWRFIHANAQGVLLDSKTQPLPSGGQGLPGAGQGASGFGMSGPSSTGGGAFGSQGMAGGGSGQSPGGFSLDSNLGGSPSNAQQNSAFFGEGNQGGGTYIVGVASTSHKQSIRIWNQKTHYDEWEFIGIDLAALGIATSIPGLPQGVGGQPGQQGQPGVFGPAFPGGRMMPGQGQGTIPPSGESTVSPQ